jgi:hypothetical protein
VGHDLTMCAVHGKSLRRDALLVRGKNMVSNRETTTFTRSREDSQESVSLFHSRRIHCLE